LLPWRTQGSLRGWFDRPAEELLLRGPQLFVGWALDGDYPASRVALAFNGTTAAEADLGMYRPDVPASLGLPRATSACGWSTWVDMAQWPEGRLDVKVTASGHTGRTSILGERSFRLAGSGLAGSVDLPPEGAEIRRDLLVAGWASTERGGVARVEISVDGQTIGRARLRIPRPDVAAVPAYHFGSFTGFEYRGSLPESASDTAQITVVAVGPDGNPEPLASRTVRRVPGGITAQETGRAAVLRRRTEESVRAARGHMGQGGPHLVVFTHSLAIGGGQLYLNELLRQLAPGWPRCTVVSPTDGDLRGELEALGIDVVVIGRVLATDLETYEGQIRDLSFFLLGFDATAVLLNTLGAWPAGDAAQRLGLPTIWSIHESFEIDHWLSATFGHSEWHLYVRERLIATLGAADRLVFEAQATSEMYAAYADAQRRVVVKYGVDTAAIARFAQTFDRPAARSAHAIPDDAVVLLSVGTLEERKSQACLVEAFVDIASTHPDAMLVMIGDSPSPYSELLHRLVNDAGLPDRIRLLPITHDIWHWYALSDVLISASDIESVPRSMLEAMALGVPALFSDVFGVPEVVEDGRSGWLFSARDMSALVAALRLVLNLSPDALRAVGQAGREIVLRDHRADAYGELYRQMLAALSRKPATSGLTNAVPRGSGHRPPGDGLHGEPSDR
jgi:glycosyltransferase involved in cell wall biosynthesis